MNIEDELRAGAEALQQMRRDIAAQNRRADALQNRVRALSLTVCLFIPLSLLLSALTPAGAQIGVTLSSLNIRMNAVEAKNTAQDQSIARNETKDTRQDEAIAAVETKNTQQDAALAAVETKTADMSIVTLPTTDDANSVNVRTVRFSGVNVQVVNGTSRTDSTNGTGNLIIGYNEFRTSANDDDRRGSHNLVVGAQNNYTVGAFGGFVVGSINTLSNAYASVTGGRENTASGAFASVSGGRQNTASGDYGSISGGRQNTASGSFANVSGGFNNLAIGLFSHVAGGQDNTASGLFSVVSGGSSGVASGDLSTNGGGADRDVTAPYGWTAGRAGGNAGISYSGNFNSP